VKNSPRNNPTKHVAAPSTQKQPLPANRAGTFTTLRATEDHKFGSRGDGLANLASVANDPGIKSSTPLIAKQGKDKTTAAQGDDDIMSQEKSV